MNSNQLATMEEAVLIARELSTVGGGVVETYVPEYAGPYAAPQDGDKKFLHFRFGNGAEGFNVGLIRTTMKMFPMSWPMMVAAEVNAGRR